jgi:ABC-type transporter Mla MlaB component
MLRITREHESSAGATLRLEGFVAADWAELLEQVCLGLLGEGTAVTLDLTSVGRVDRAGVEALERLGRAGIAIHCPPGPVAGLLEAEGVRMSPSTP